MKNIFAIGLAAVAVMLAPAGVSAGEGDPGSGISGTDSPSSQPMARKQAGPFGHCTHDWTGRAHCRRPRYQAGGNPFAASPF
jgi:hypothetical protein